MAEGHIMVIGGAEDKVRERVILTRFVALAGGPDARIAVISSASSLGPLAGEMYRKVFTELGAAEVWPIHATTRDQANDDHAARTVRDSTGVFMTGGNQLRLSSTIGGTALAQAVADRHRHGSVVAGTSAGASAMSSHMVAFGASGGTPKQRMVQMAAGLGILPGVIVDQHFQQRNRLGPAARDHRPEPGAARPGHRRGHLRRGVAGHGDGGHRPAERDHRRRRRRPRRTPGRSARTGRS